MYFALGKLISFKLASSIIRVINWLNRKPLKFKPPMMILQGDKDHYTKLKSVKKFVRNLRCEEIFLNIIEGGYHELVLDKEKNIVFDKIHEWILSHLSNKTKSRNFINFPYKQEVNYTERVKVKKIVFYVLLYLTGVVM